jgi:hypothetical protein
MRLLSGALVFAVVAACSLLDSVDDYAGPPANSGGSSNTGGQSGDGSVSDVAAACVDAAECDDDNPCTTDSCWGNLCKHDPTPGVSCSDGNVCNGDEICDGVGECEPGTPLKLDDDNPCTDDACDPIQGVSHTLQADPVFVKVVCGSVTCPAGYYVSKLSCLSECGGCDPTFCVNGVECTRICEKTLPVCCGNSCGDDCPAGYTETATSTTGNCGCGPGLTATCTR